jgi:hypothetical protein
MAPSQEKYYTSPPILPADQTLSDTMPSFVILNGLEPEWNFYIARLPVFFILFIFEI